MTSVSTRPRPDSSAGAFRIPDRARGRAPGRPRRRPAVCTALILAALAVLFPSAAARGQTLSDLMQQTAKQAPRDTVDNRAPAAPWTVVAGEMVLGTALAAGLGYGVGLIAESFCDECDAGQPGGDTPGLLTGVPAGAFAGVWLVGRLAPPSGRLGDTLVGAMAGTAVFTAYGKIIEQQSDLVRWAGVVLPAALAATGWNRSRFLPEPELSWRRPPPTRWGTAETTVELRLVALRF